MQPATRPTGAHTLPPELWLELLPHIPYTPRTHLALHQTCSSLHALITTHEHTLVSAIKATQHTRQTTSDLYPDLALTTYAGLHTLHHRQQTLENLHGQWLHIVTAENVDLHWLKGKWEAVHKVGLLLLYRLQDVSSTSEETAYEARIQLMHALPAPSLACLLFKLISSIKILRVYGPEPIRGTYRNDCLMVRSDVELALEELLLLHGPEFFVALLGMDGKEMAKGAERREWAVSTLRAEIAAMPDRQAPYPSGAAKPPTLIASLRRALAGQAGVDVSQTVSAMWEILSGTAFDEVGEEMLGMLVKGEEVERGMRRMGF